MSSIRNDEQHETRTTRTRKTIASLALAMLGTSLLVAHPAPARAEDPEPVEQVPHQGTITCGQNEGLAIFVNTSEVSQRVALSYSHGCSKGWLGVTMNDEGEASSWIPGCGILKRGITSTKESCTVTLPAGASIFVVQTEDYAESTGPGHTWAAQGI